MSDKRDKTAIEQAWALAEDPQKIKHYYQQWSDHYDVDVAAEHYHGPRHMVALLAAQLDVLWPDADRHSLRLLDAGCGTGLVGIELLKHGYSNLSGFDLSAEMVAQAAAKRCYQSLVAGVDLMQPLRPQLAGDIEAFDVAVCVGVLTLGHVPPAGVYQLLDAVRSGGVVALTARDVYVREHDFEGFCKRLVEQHKIRILYQEYGPSVGKTLGLYIILQKQ